MGELERALSQIADIRARMSASSRFRGFAPEAMAFGSVFSLATAMAQTLWPAALASSGPRYLAVWGAACVCCSAICAIEAISRSRSLHGAMAGAMLGSTLRQLLPFGAAGAVIAGVSCSGAPQTAWVVPGIWLLLIGLAGLSAATSLPRTIVWPSAWYFFCGALVLGLAGGGLPLSPWMLGLPLAIGQAMVAFVVVRRGDES